MLQLNPEGRKQTKKFRSVVPLSETLEEILRGVPGKRYVEWNGKPVASVRKSFAFAASEAGLSDEVTPYSLRRTMAIELRKKGVPAWEVEGMLGHRRPGVTEEYALFAPDYGSQSRVAIDAYFQRLDLPLRK